MCDSMPILDEFNFNDLNFDFLESPPRPQQVQQTVTVERNQCTPAQPLRPKVRNSTQELSKRIAEVDLLVRQIRQTEKERDDLRNQLEEFNKSAREVQSLYAIEKQKRVKQEARAEELLEINKNLDTDLAAMTLEVDQLRAQLDSMKGPIEYGELAVRFLKMVQKVDDDRALHWHDQAVVRDLQKYCKEKDLKVPPATQRSPRKRKLSAAKVDMETQCDIGEVEMVTTTRKELREQGTQCAKVTTRNQGCQYIGTTTTRGTTTSCFFKYHDVGVNCNLMDDRSVFNDMLDVVRTWSTPVAPLSPIADLETSTSRSISSNIFPIQLTPLSPGCMTSNLSISPPKPIIEHKTVGTCTDICNVQRHVDYITQLPTIKRSDSRPPSRLMFESVKGENPTCSTTTTPLPLNSLNNQLPSISNTFSTAFDELWQIFGHMLYGLLHRRVGNVIPFSNQTNAPSNITNQQEFYNWLRSLYFDIHADQQTHIQRPDMQSNQGESHLEINSNRAGSTTSENTLDQHAQHPSLESPLNFSNAVPVKDTISGQYLFKPKAQRSGNQTIDDETTTGCTERNSIGTSPIRCIIPSPIFTEKNEKVVDEPIEYNTKNATPSAFISTKPANKHVVETSCSTELNEAADKALQLLPSTKNRSSTQQSVQKLLLKPRRKYKLKRLNKSRRKIKKETAVDFIANLSYTEEKPTDLIEKDGNQSDQTKETANREQKMKADNTKDVAPTPQKTHEQKLRELNRRLFGNETDDEESNDDKMKYNLNDTLNDISTDDEREIANEDVANCSVISDGGNSKSQANSSSNNKCAFSVSQNRNEISNACLPANNKNRKKNLCRFNSVCQTDYSSDEDFSKLSKPQKQSETSHSCLTVSADYSDKNSFKQSSGESRADYSSDDNFCKLFKPQKHSEERLRRSKKKYGSESDISNGLKKRKIICNKSFKRNKLESREVAAETFKNVISTSSEDSLDDHGCDYDNSTAYKQTKKDYNAYSNKSKEDVLSPIMNNSPIEENKASNEQECTEDHEQKYEQADNRVDTNYNTEPIEKETTNSSKAIQKCSKAAKILTEIAFKDQKLVASKQELSKELLESKKVQVQLNSSPSSSSGNESELVIVTDIEETYDCELASTLPKKRGRKRKSESSSLPNLIATSTLNTPCKRSARLLAKRTIKAEQKNEQQTLRTPFPLGKYTTRVNKVEQPSMQKEPASQRMCAKSADICNEAISVMGYYREKSESDVAAFEKDAEQTSLMHEKPDDEELSLSPMSTSPASSNGKIYAENLTHPPISPCSASSEEFNTLASPSVSASESSFLMSPASPTPLDNMEIDDKAIKIIPLEHIAQNFWNRRHKSLLSNLINSYDGHNYRSFNPPLLKIDEKKAVTNLEAYFREYITSSTQNEQVSAQLIEKVFSATKDVKIIAHAVCAGVQDTQRAVTAPYDDLKNTQAPILNRPAPSVIFKSMKNVIGELIRRQPEFTHSLLTVIETILFNGQNADSISLNVALNLTDLYLLTLTLQFNPTSGNPARLFIAKCFYYHKVKAIPMIYAVLCEFPTTLPHREERNYDRSDPLITVIQHLLMCTTYNMENHQLFHREMLSKLRFVYHFEVYKPDFQDVLTNLIEKLRAGKFENLKYALVLFCKRQPAERVVRDIIQAHLIPLSNEYYNHLQQTTAYDEHTAALLDCFSSVIKPFPRDINSALTVEINNYLNIFQRFLSVAERPIIQEAAVHAILRLQRFNFINCYNALASFYPEYELQSVTRAALRTFIYRKSQGFWKNLLAQNG